MSLDRRKIGWIYAGLDIAAAEAAFFSAVLLRYDGALHPIPPFFGGVSYFFYAVLILLLYGPILLSLGVHRERTPSIRALAKAVLVIAVLVNVLPFYFQDYAFSRFVFLAFSGLTLFFGLAWRFVFYILLLGNTGLAHLVRERVALVAVSSRLASLARAVRAFGPGRYEVVAETPADPAADQGHDSTEPSGCLEDLPALAVEAGADLVLLDPEGIRPARWLTLAERLHAAGISLRLFVGSEPGPPLAVGESANGAGLELLAEPISGFRASVKRTLDVVVASVVLVAALPLMLILSLAIRLSSRGPLLYIQERVGRNGRPFRMFKFRSMVHEAENGTGPVWSGPGDRRVIPGIGQFLRRTGLDELPQFWNVLTGEMSLVGPRPERAFFFDSYPELYRGRLAVRPGLTGLAQLNCRASTSVELKVSYDLYYIRNYSFPLDLEILWRTSAMLARQEWEVLVRGGNGNGEQK